MTLLVEGNRSYPIISEKLKLDPKNFADMSEERRRLAVVRDGKSGRPTDGEFDALSIAVVKAVMGVKEKSNGSTYGWFESAEYEYIQFEPDGPFHMCLVIYGNPELDAAAQQQVHQELADEIFAAIEAEDHESFVSKGSASKLRNDARIALRKYRKKRNEKTLTFQRAEVPTVDGGESKGKLVAMSATLPRKTEPKNTAKEYDGLAKIVAIDDDSRSVTFRSVSSDSKDPQPDMIMRAKNEKQFKLLKIASALETHLEVKLTYEIDGKMGSGVLKQDSVDFSRLNGKSLSMIAESKGYPRLAVFDDGDAVNDDAVLDKLG